MRTLTMTNWTCMTLVCMYWTLGQTVGVTLEDRLSPNVIQSLEQLCPRVDICNGDATDPGVKPNRNLDGDKYISVCHGCSCHEDCHIMLSCCFPDDLDITIDDKTTTPRITNNSHADIGTTQMAPNMSSNNVEITTKITENTLGFGKNSSDDRENTFADDQSDPVDKENTSEYPYLFTRQCRYGRSGSPDETWIPEFAAYRMVSKVPPGGCKTNMVYHPDGDHTLHDPCGSEPVAPWGDLFPVYSDERDTIYKNEQCARCHGANDYKQWTPTLVCDSYDMDKQRTIPVSEHFAFLQQNSSSSHCFISFDYQDIAVMQNNRCYVDTVTTCSVLPSNKSFTVPEGINLTQLEIETACSSGLNSPVQIDTVYRNAFCAICSNNEYGLRGLLKFVEFQSSRSFVGRMSYLLDTSLMKENTRSLVPYPQVCLRNGSMLENKSCRNIFCSSGQVRNKGGVCKFLSRRWYRGLFSITLKLKYDTKNTPILEILNSGVTNREILFTTFRSTNPWPSYWKIIEIMHTPKSENTDNLHFIVVELVADIIRPAVVRKDIRTAMMQPWTMAINGARFTFKQSLLEFSVANFQNMILPQWQTYADELNQQFKVSNVSSFKWNTLYHGSASQARYEISKLFTCEQVSLFNDEHAIMPNRYILMNKLSGRMLLDKEFELIEDERGRMIPRVCLSDTPLVLNTERSCAMSLYGVLPTGLSILVPCILQTIWFRF